IPLRSLAPRSLSSKRLPRSLRVPSAMTTVFGSAIPWQTRCKVWCPADDAAFLRFARSSQIADNDQPSSDANTGLQRSRRLKCDHRRDQLQPGTHRPLGIVLMSLGVATVDKHAVAHIPRHKTAEAAYGFSGAFLIGRNDLAQVLWVHAGGKRRRADQVGEHHCDLPSLGSIRGWASRRDDRCETDRACTRSKRTNNFQELETSTKRQTHLAEMILREIVQDVGVDRVLAQYRLILFEAKSLQATSDVHEGVLLQPGAHYLSTPMRVMRGALSFSSSSHLPAMVGSMLVKPVTLPAGRG